MTGNWIKRRGRFFIVKYIYIALPSLFSHVKNFFWGNKTLSFSRRVTGSWIKLKRMFCNIFQSLLIFKSYLVNDFPVVNRKHVLLGSRLLYFVEKHEKKIFLPWQRELNINQRSGINMRYMVKSSLLSNKGIHDMCKKCLVSMIKIVSKVLRSLYCELSPEWFLSLPKGEKYSRPWVQCLAIYYDN